MEKRSIDGIPPYRMAQIAKTAADVADRISWWLRQSVNAKMNKEDKDVY